MKTTLFYLWCLGNICCRPCRICCAFTAPPKPWRGTAFMCKAAALARWRKHASGHAPHLQQHGIAAAGFSSSKIRRQDIDAYDFLIVMDDDNLAEPERPFRAANHT